MQSMITLYGGFKDTQQVEAVKGRSLSEYIRLNRKKYNQYVPIGHMVSEEL